MTKSCNAQKVKKKTHASATYGLDLPATGPKTIEFSNCCAVHRVFMKTFEVSVHYFISWYLRPPNAVMHKKFQDFMENQHNLL